MEENLTKNPILRISAAYINEDYHMCKSKVDIVSELKMLSLQARM